MVAHEDEYMTSGSDEILLIKPEDDNRVEDINERSIDGLHPSTFSGVISPPCTTGRATYFAREYSDVRLLPLHRILLQNMRLFLRQNL